ncbi:ribokinase [Paucibacter sp. AS339]|uniref:ribokinase n=1 Tax=Paucibacter hankyongi TaxID=3133434 RepID=UPI0030A32BCD
MTTAMAANEINRAEAGARVAVIGSINMDMVAHASRLPAAGETLAGDDFVMAPGGKGANQAVAAARLGARVDFVSRIGTRQYGEELLRSLQAEGIGCEGVQLDAAALPGIAVIMVGREGGGENAIVYVPGSNAQLNAADVSASASMLQKARVVVAQTEVPLAAIQQGFALARVGGALTVLNAAPALPLSDALLSLVDWLVVNETEALQLSGLQDKSLDGLYAAAQVLQLRGVKQVLVTLGAEGVLLCCAGQAARQLPAFTVDAVDTVGAGDTFVGGLATGLAEGRSAVEAVRLGQAAASIAVGRCGVQTAMPTRAELPAEFAA